MSSDFRYALLLSLIGFLITFGVLALIAIATRAMRAFDRGWRDREEAERERRSAKPPEIDETTLVLISAAVAAVLRGRGRIRSIRRLTPGDSPQSAWSVQGRMVLLGSHVVPKKTR